MKLIIKEKKTLVTEVSKANPVDVLTKIAVKSIVDLLTLNPPVEDAKIQPVFNFRKELERLKRESPKYNKFKIENLYLDYYGSSTLTNKFGAAAVYVSEKDIYIYFEPPYRFNEIKMYNEIKKGKGQSREIFERELEKAKNSKQPFFNRNMKPPEYTKSKTANEENLRMYAKGLQMRPYHTEENIISGIEGGKAKGRIYNWLMSKTDALRSAFSSISHEIRHSYQFGNEAFRKQLKAFDARGLRQLELRDRFYQNDNYEKKEIDRSIPGQVMTSYYYYTSPIEIDARLTQYRKAKKQMPEKSYFDIIFKDEKAIVDSLNARPTFKEVIDLATKEMKSKAMFLILNQIKMQDKKIFESDPRFEEELQKAFAGIKETLNDERFIKAKKFLSQTY